MDAPHFQHRYAENGGVRLHYVAAERPQNATAACPVMLFVHGIPGFWNIWHAQLAHFASRFTVAAMDLRGFNASAKPGARELYTLPYLIRDVLAVATALSPRQPIILVGHDFGAIIAWWCAMLQPHRLRALVAISAPHPHAYLAARADRELNYRTEFRSQLLDAKAGAPLDADLLARRICDPQRRRELIDALQVSAVEGIRDYYRANLGGADVIGTAPKVRVPTLMAVGTADTFVPRRYYESCRQWVEARCDLVAIDDGDHDCHCNQADAVNAGIDRWLADIIEEEAAP